MYVYILSEIKLYYIIINAIFSDRAVFTFLPSPYASHVNVAAANIGHSCQRSEMATLLNSLSFVFKISFLPKYRVIYYDYIVKWCSGI